MREDDELCSWKEGRNQLSARQAMLGPHLYTSGFHGESTHGGHVHVNDWDSARTYTESRTSALRVPTEASHQNVGVANEGYSSQESLQPSSR